MSETTPYVTPEDAVAKLGAQLYRILGVPEGADVSANPELLSALDSANARIDTALRGRYPVPFALEFVPAALKQPAIDLFRYYLLGVMQQAVSSDDRMRYEDAEKYLGQLSRGEARLDIPGTEEAPQNSVTAISGRMGSAVDPNYDGYFADIGYNGIGPARRC